MYTHAPPGYVCPFCLVVAGVENEHVRTTQDDIVLRGQLCHCVRRSWLVAE